LTGGFPLIKTGAGEQPSAPGRKHARASLKARLRDRTLSQHPGDTTFTMPMDWKSLLNADRRRKSTISGDHRAEFERDFDRADLSRCLRTLGETRVYPTRSTLTLELMGRKVIGDLMDVFSEGAAAMPTHGAPDTFSSAGKAAALFSPNYRKVFQHFAEHCSDNGTSASVTRCHDAASGDGKAASPAGCGSARARFISKCHFQIS
jgi:hypothetical protein